MRLHIFILILWVLLFIGNIFLLVKFPEYNNALTSFLITFILSALSAVVGYSQTTVFAAKSANQRWMPQAEGACDGLLNLCYTIKRFQASMAYSCQELRQNVSQLDDPQNLPIKLFIRQQCDNSVSRLRDIANHLESAYADWERFIRQNCEAGECETIFNNLRSLRNRLEQELATVNVMSQDCNALGDG